MHLVADDGLHHGVRAASRAARAAAAHGHLASEMANNIMNRGLSATCMGRGEGAASSDMRGMKEGLLLMRKKLRDSRLLGHRQPDALQHEGTPVRKSSAQQEIKRQHPSAEQQQHAPATSEGVKCTTCISLAKRRRQKEFFWLTFCLAHLFHRKRLAAFAFAQVTPS